MKKMFFILAACVALVACKKAQLETGGTATPFVEGQQVTITVSANDNNGASRIIGVDNDSCFSFKWETGDKIKVTVRDTTYPEPGFTEFYEVTISTAEFTITSGAGTKTATFSGTMPGSSSYFEIQYPVTSPDLSTQTYDAGRIASGLMSFGATGCTIVEGKCNVTLQHQNAILQLNLYGIARSVSKIVVSDYNSSAVSYTLNCSTPVTVSQDKDNPTPFYIVMNPASIRLKIDVTMNEGTPVQSDLADYLTYGKGTPISKTTFEQSSAKTISAGQCVNMPAISLTTIWAPVNCGYDPVNYKYGKLYQWGRHDGCGYIGDTGSGMPSDYDDAGGITQNCPNPGSVCSQITASAEDAQYFYNTIYEYQHQSYNTDWLTPQDDYRWDGTGGSINIHFATKTQYDPCPPGWRVPTYQEMATLMGGNTSTGEFPTSTHGTTTGIAGRWFNGSTETTPTTGVFLPAAGLRYANASAVCGGRQTTVGDYWTSSVSADRACRMGFTDTNTPRMSFNDNRSGGYSVRCVQE